MLLLCLKTRDVVRLPSVIGNAQQVKATLNASLGVRIYASRGREEHQLGVCIVRKAHKNKLSPSNLHGV